MKPRNRRLLSALSFDSTTATSAATATSLMLAVSVHAADWTGSSSQDWNTTANWSASPAGVNDTINLATGNFPVISAAPTFTPVDLFIANGAGATGRLDQSTGTLALANTSTNGNWMFVGINTGTGTYNLTGNGSLAVGKLWIGGQVYGENGTGTATINTTGTVTANSTDDFSGWGQYQTSVSIGWGATGNGTLNIQNGTLNSPNKPIYVGSWGGTGTLNQSGGTVNANGLILGRWFNTNATANITGGTLNAGFVQLSASGNGGDHLVGELNVNTAGTLNSEGDFSVAVGGNASSTGTLNIGTGGIVNIATTTERWMMVNQWDTPMGIVNVNGGTLNLNANTDLRFSTNGNTGASSVTLGSGAITSYSSNGTGGATSGVLDLNNAGGAASNNTFNLDGGTLTIAQVFTNNNNGTATFNLNGGTLKASNNSANFVDLGGAGQSAIVKAGGALIDSNGYNITIVQPLLDGGTGGGLVKSGAGVLTLSGANTYSGNTTVNAGQLTLADNASLKIVLGDSGVNNKLTGTGSVQLDGDFTLDTTAASTTVGSSWQVVDVGTLSVSYGSTFTLTGGTETSPGSGVWIVGSYRFTASTGIVDVLSDSDSDGLSDAWEQQIIDANSSDGITNISQVNPGDDFDGDGFSNLDEYTIGTSPIDAAFTPENIDGDGLADSWEILYFTNITAQNGSGDPDGDLATNLQEFQGSTDPSSLASWPDSDNDLMNDGWETAFFTDLSKDGTLDTDSDGFTDLEEHDAHTNPVVASLSPIWTALKHRWSFNGDLTDSVGGSHATIVEVGANNVTQNPASVTLTGGDKAASDYVSLGSQLLPKSTTPVTIELWAKQNSIQNWSRIFDFHSGTTEYLMMAWTMGQNNATDRLEFNDNATSVLIDNKNQPYGTAEEYHIVVTLEPLAGASGRTRISLYTAASGATDLGPAKAVAETTSTLVHFNDALNALGYSPWPDNTANATYDEFRIWNGALFGWMREKLHDQGANNAAIPDVDGDRLPDDWETAWFSNTTTATSLSGDSDGDTFTDLQEYVAGSNPNNNLATPEDLDADGLADYWETTWFGNIAAQNGSGDPDLDGLTNEQEETAGSNPNDDEDGLPAAWEIFFFGSTTTQNGTDDSDGDGVSNLDEYLVSQPNNILSTPTDVNGDGSADTAQHKLTVGDGVGTTSFNTGLNWNDTLIPAAGETYIVPVEGLRTPPGVGDFTFAGAQLDLIEIYTGFPSLIVKNDGVTNVPLLTLNGSRINHASTIGFLNTLAGSINVRGPLASEIFANNGPFLVSAVISGTTRLNLTGANTVTLTGVNTHTGIISTTGGGLILNSSGALKFVPLASGVNNTIAGTSAVTLNGTFNIDLAGASTNPGSTWDLVTSTGALTIGANFNVSGFTPNSGTVGTRIWTSGSYQFDEATGVLSVGSSSDTDTDGMDDAWETTHFGGLAQSAADDFDGDGTDNLTEYRLGLVPNNGASVFAATRDAATGQLTWPSKEGVTFRIERSSTLGAWTTLEAALPAAANPATSTSYTPPAVTGDKVFYRIGLNP